VIGEMLAGLMLGPSLFGWIALEWFGRVFPPTSLPTLELLSQMALVVFMFALGGRIARAPHRTGLVKKSIALLSVTSVVAPFVLGLALGPILYVRLAPPDVPALPFTLFVATSISITAFPVLARIIEEFDLIGTRLGIIAIACAAFDDVLGWTLVALTVALMHAERGTGLVRHLLLFGSFFLGFLVPRRAFGVGRLIDVVEKRVSPLLLPLFFAFTGLRADLQAIGSPALWRYTALILTIAIVGKAGASTVAAAAAGLPAREAWSLGILLNTRGLVELVILSIGLDTGILSPRLYSMFVVMTFVTTLMTSPLLTWLGTGRRRARDAASQLQYR
jgi:Kef-type K+ transport system membrane component KefB